MMKQLRWRFIKAIMASAFALLVVVLVSVNILIFVNMDKRATHLLDSIAENNGVMIDVSSDYRENVLDYLNSLSDTYYHAAEVSYTTRFFYVRYADEGKAEAVNIDNISAITAETAKEFAELAIESGKEKGYIKSGYKYTVVDSEVYGTTVYFMDISDEIVSINLIIRVSVIIGLVAFALLFVIVLLISNKVVQPMVENTVRQKQFITDAGHELKTPLAIISANAEVLEMMHGENEWLTSIRNQTNRLSDLIKNLLVLSKAEETSQKDSFSEVAISDIISATVASFSTLSNRAGKRLYAEVQPTLTIWGNEKSIAELTNILLDNAVKYAPQGSKIELSLYQKGRQVILETSNYLVDSTVVDTERLFDRFYRSEKSRSRQTGGYGIGLSIAGAIVKAHKANISAATNDGKITFTVVFKIEN